MSLSNNSEMLSTATSKAIKPIEENFQMWKKGMESKMSNAISKGPDEIKSSLVDVYNKAMKRGTEKIKNGENPLNGFLEEISTDTEEKAKNLFDKYASLEGIKAAERKAKEELNTQRESLNNRTTVASENAKPQENHTPETPQNKPTSTWNALSLAVDKNGGWMSGEGLKAGIIAAGLYAFESFTSGMGSLGTTISSWFKKTFSSMFKGSLDTLKGETVGKIDETKYTSNEGNLVVETEKNSKNINYIAVDGKEYIIESNGEKTQYIRKGGEAYIKIGDDEYNLDHLGRYVDGLIENGEDTDTISVSNNRIEEITGMKSPLGTSPNIRLTKKESLGQIKDKTIFAKDVEITCKDSIKIGEKVDIDYMVIEGKKYTIKPTQGKIKFVKKGAATHLLLDGLKDDSIDIRTIPERIKPGNKNDAGEYYLFDTISADIPVVGKVEAPQLGVNNILLIPSTEKVETRKVAHKEQKIEKIPYFRKTENQLETSINHQGKYYEVMLTMNGDVSITIDENTTYTYKIDKMNIVNQQTDSAFEKMQNDIKNKMTGNMSVPIILKTGWDEINKDTFSDNNKRDLIESMLRKGKLQENNITVQLDGNTLELQFNKKTLA